MFFAKQFLDFAKELKVHHPVRGIINLEIHPYLERLGNSFFDHRFVIAKKFRQGAFTTFTTGYGLWTALNKPNHRILLLSKTDKESIALNERVKRFIEYGVHAEITAQNHHKIEFANGSSLVFLTPEAGRGKMAHLLIIDEAAFIQNMDVHWKALYPCVATGAQVIALSTTNGLGNWFHQTYTEAEAGLNSFYAVATSYLGHPDYLDEEWVATVRKNLGERGFRQELLCEFLGPNIPGQEMVKNFFKNLTSEEAEKLLDLFKTTINSRPSNK